ncbi:MAG: tyrosine recombinase XerC [Cardiobacteriaceae bacterium]|nr:tyrosine recombinase XerC [Cardiobacteriaceae bacterium]
MGKFLMNAEIKPPIAELEQYLKYLKFERMMRPHTLSAYQRLLSKALSVVGAQPTTESLQHYLLQERKRGLDPKSLNLIRAALRGYFQYLQQQGIRKDNPATLLKLPKRQKQALPKTLSIEQIDVLLRPEHQAPSESEKANFIALRDIAIMELFYSTGMRLSELTALNVGDIAGQEITITGKGGYQRVVFIGETAQSALQQWLNVRGALQGQHEENALFLSHQFGKRLSQRAVQLLVKEHGKQKLYGQNVHPHMFRHSFASHMLQSSQDIRAVQEFLGHQRLSTTQIYTHLDHQHLSKVYDQAHPRAKRKKEEDA